MPPKPDPILETTLLGQTFKTPVLLAAGTAGTIDEMAGVVPFDAVGGIVCKSITADPRDGNQPWRILDSRVGMLNAIGLANPGIDRFLTDFAPRAGALQPVIIASVAGYTVDDYVGVVGKLDAWAAAQPEGSIAAVELNISCPNVSTGLEFGKRPETLAPVVREVRAVADHLKLIVKLSPIVDDPVAVAQAAIEAGADALTISNTVPAMEIDVESRTPRLANVTGGLSGPAIHPIVVRLIHQVYRGIARDTNTPIFGVGGVMNANDAAQFILAGASAVQVGTALFADPLVPRRIARGLARWTRRLGASSLSELVGSVRIP